MEKILKVGSFFAGVGGICLGFLNARNHKYKYELVFANEIDTYACATYKHNFTHTLLEGDINFVLNPNLSSDVDYYQKLHEIMFSQSIDVLNGGFPCQAFSIAGEQKGFDDSRGNLFLSFIEFIEQHYKIFNKKPRFLFLENVKNLKSHDNGKTYKVIKTKLEDSGYIIKEIILNTMDFSNLPQNRERIYIVGFLNEEDANTFTMFSHIEDFKKVLTKEDRLNSIKDIIDYEDNDQSLFYTKDKYPKYFQDENNENAINLDRDINEMYQFYQLRRGQYIRKNQSNVCPTLTANMGTGGHNVPLILTKDGVRKISAKEAFKLQGFPIDNGYSLPTRFNNKTYAKIHLYKQAGNAVSVPIITLIANEILNSIKD